MIADWLADVLRSAGLTVVEHDGWKDRSHGAFTSLRAVVYHHDASPEGASPGVPAYMIRNWNTASANCWVALDGTWHVIAAGVAYHAGKVLRGKPGNSESLGVECDHTTGETWPPEQLDSLRRGTAAILARLGRDESGLEFHKTICDPPGRKTDPDGLDLGTERQALAALLASPPSKETDDMAMTALVPWVPRRPNGRLAFLEVINTPGANEALVVSYNDAPFTPPYDDKRAGDAPLFGFWSRKLTGLTGPATGIALAPDGKSVVVTCRGGGTYEVARRAA